MPTMSAELCRCGTQMEYVGDSKSTLVCSHCDVPCQINVKKGDPCPLCEEFNEQWRYLMKDFYGPGRGI